VNLFLQTPDSVETVARGVADGSGASRFATATHPTGATTLTSPRLDVLQIPEPVPRPQKLITNRKMRDDKAPPRVGYYLDI
jgi:hypothetical protein